MSTAWSDARADDDHVGSGDRLGQAIEADGHAVDAFGERRAAFGGAVGDEDLGATRPTQGDGDALAHRPAPTTSTRRPESSPRRR